VNCHRSKAIEFRHLQAYPIGNRFGGKPLREVVVVTYLATVSKASLGVGHSCAVMTDGALWCWGANDHGQLGDGQIVGSSVGLVTVPKRISFPCP
jgi:alpha-tubulin suppressor-like RCC1 family protein